MTANYLLVLIVGMICGGGLGYITAWRFARRLEHHEVVLAEWDQQLDFAAKTPAQTRNFGS